MKKKKYNSPTLNTIEVRSQLLIDTSNNVGLRDGGSLKDENVVNRSRDAGSWDDDE